MADDRAAGREGLGEELRALSRALAVGPPRADLDVMVLARIQAEPAPVASPLRRALAGAARRRLGLRGRVAVAMLVALVALLIATPASARIAEWFGLGGVVVVQVPDAGTSTRPADPAAPGPGAEVVTLAQARGLAAFPVGVPAELGDPDRVLITPGARVVSLVWEEPGGPVRLDQFLGRPDLAVAKKYSGAVEFTNVGPWDALWLARPHPMVYLDAMGVERTDLARTSGPSLIWLRGATTLRLEGVANRDRAIAIAGSLTG